MYHYHISLIDPKGIHQALQVIGSSWDKAINAAKAKVGYGPDQGNEVLRSCSFTGPVDAIEQ